MRWPTYYLMVPAAEREQRCWLTDDLCVIDQKQFFIYGSLEVPIEEWFLHGRFEGGG